MTLASLADNGRDVLLALVTYLAVEVRRDVRFTRDKVLVLWEDHEKRQGRPVAAPPGAYKSSSLQRELL